MCKDMSESFRPSLCTIIYYREALSLSPTPLGPCDVCSHGGLLQVPELCAQSTVLGRGGHGVQNKSQISPYCPGSGGTTRQEERASFPMASSDQGQQEVSKTSGKPFLPGTENSGTCPHPLSFHQAGFLNEVGSTQSL